jgi:hypothetical protein
MVAPLVRTSVCTKPGKSFAATSFEGFGGSSGKDVAFISSGAGLVPDRLFPKTPPVPTIAAPAATAPFFKNARRFSASITRVSPFFKVG